MRPSEEARIHDRIRALNRRVNRLEQRLEKNMTTTRHEVFIALEQERDYQDRKWGESAHPVPSWILFMEHHLQFARVAAATQSSDHAALDELRKVTALGVACMEQHGVPPRIG